MTKAYTLTRNGEVVEVYLTRLAAQAARLVRAIADPTSRWTVEEIQRLGGAEAVWGYCAMPAR